MLKSSHLYRFPENCHIWERVKKTIAKPGVTSNLERFVSKMWHQHFWSIIFGHSLSFVTITHSKTRSEFWEKMGRGAAAV